MGDVADGAVFDTLELVEVAKLGIVDVAAGAVGRGPVAGAATTRTETAHVGRCFIEALGVASLHALLLWGVSVVVAWRTHNTPRLVAHLIVIDALTTTCIAF